MQRAEFSDLMAANERVRQWAEQIGNAITEHLLAELGGGGICSSGHVLRTRRAQLG